MNQRAFRGGILRKWDSMQECNTVTEIATAICPSSDWLADLFRLNNFSTVDCISKDSQTLYYHDS